MVSEGSIAYATTSLLIVRTAHIVTRSTFIGRVVTDNSEFPANSRLRTTTSPSWGAAPFTCRRASYLRHAVTSGQDIWPAGRSFLPPSLCRHRVRTVSSSLKKRAMPGVQSLRVLLALPRACNAAASRVDSSRRPVSRSSGSPHRSCADAAASASRLQRT